MALTDPRSIIREILSRRPDLHQAYAPQLNAAGIQVAGLGPAVEARRRLEAANALRSGQVQDTTLGPVPPNMGSFASSSPPLPTPDFSGETRRRLDALNNPTPGGQDYGREYERAAMRSPMGDQGPLQPLPGSMDYGRERERALMRSPFGDQGPGAGPTPPGLLPGGPMPPSFGAGPGSEAARLPQFRPSFAPGTAEASLPPPVPQARPSISPGPVPPNMGSFPQRPAPGAGLVSDTGGMPPQIAALMPGGAGSAWPGSPPPRSPFEPNMPRARPPNIPQARPPQEGPGPNLADFNQPPPLSSDQRIDNVPGSGPAPPIDPAIAAAAQRAVAPPVAGFDPRSPFSRPTSPLTPNLRGERLDLTAGTSPPGPQIGSTVLSPLVQDYATGAGAGQPSQLARMPRPRPPIEQQPGDLIAGPPEPPTITGQDLPAPGQSSSILTPQQIQRTMGAQALYNAPPPGMNVDTIRRLGFGDTSVDPSKAPRQLTGSGVGKWAGMGLGALKGLAEGGPIAAGIGGYLGYKGGKKIGGLLGDRDFGLGARFTNPNYAAGMVANAPPPLDASGVPAITPPVDIPTTGAQGGIFGQGMRGIGRQMQRAIAAVAGGKMSPDAASKAFGVPKDSLHDSLGSMGSGGRGMGGNYGGGFGGGGGYGGGGTYGGIGGSRINEGIGQRFGNR